MRSVVRAPDLGHGNKSLTVDVGSAAHGAVDP